uniref:Uncharacterized protein n=1 Tax=Arundo donax TaxID=35708 RepID=A0A0A8YVC1_ARUDO
MVGCHSFPTHKPPIREGVVGMGH